MIFFFIWVKFLGQVWEISFGLSLVKPMKKILTMEKEKRIEMGKRGKLWVLEEFSEEKIVAKYLEIL